MKTKTRGAGVAPAVADVDEAAAVGEAAAPDGVGAMVGAAVDGTAVGTGESGGAAIAGAAARVLEAGTGALVGPAAEGPVDVIDGATEADGSGLGLVEGEAV